ncbi:MAG: ABC transporter permease [Clostridiales bacterium]|nr:ABC transporter permease [Clostridiales bacterium]
MIIFVLRKMLNKKWLMAALLIGNILLVAIAASSPMYTKASLQRMLTETFSNYVEENGRYASTAYLVATVNPYSRADSSYVANFINEDKMAQNMAGELGITAKHVLRNIGLTEVVTHPVGMESQRSQTVEIAFLSGLEDHINIVNGSLYEETVINGVIEAVVSQKALINMDLIIGEELVVDELEWPDGSPVKIKIAGVFDSDEKDDGYWYKSPSTYTTQLMIPENVFNQLTGDYGSLPYKLKGLWFVILDYTGITTDNAEFIYSKTEDYTQAHNKINNISYRNYYGDILEQYLVDAKRTTVTLRILQIPIYALLAAFIFMVAGQILEMESSEISVIRSRGAGRKQVILVYLTQSGVVALIALVAGIPLSSLICQILGSSNVFLEFVSRKALIVEYTDTVFTYAIAAALFSVIAMVLPVFKYAKASIVNQKQRKNRSDKPFVQRFFLDFVLLAISLYGLYSFNGQKEMLSKKVMEGAGLDPLLFLSSSLFIIGAALVCLRIIPAVVWLIYRIGKKSWKPDLFASFLWVLRTRGSQGYIIAFLVVTIAIGIFNSQTARTINTNEESRIKYMNGAEIVLQEPWLNNMAEVAEDDIGIVKLTYSEPDSRKYYELAGVESITKVIYDDNASCSSTTNRWTSATVMGIHTKEFGNTVGFDTSLLPVHWYRYLNAISQNPTAVLVSSNMKENLGYKLGDTITYNSKDHFTARGVIYGFIDFWPTYNPTILSIGEDGLIKETENYLIVANFSYLQSQWGLTPYQIWINAEHSSDFMYDFATNTGTSFTVFRDTNADIVALKNDPIFQGTNGILTVGFVIVLIVCTVGFLIYWILSIRSRELLFGIFRAMGMTMREISKMLINEQIFISGISVGLGVVVGLLVSKLYLPLVQIAYASVDTVIPLRVVSESSDMIRLLVVMFAVIAICMLILSGLIRKIKISQALKLGEE